MRPMAMRLLALPVLAALALAAGCGTGRQVSAFKDAAQEGDYTAIAASEVTCTADEDGCNQAHLIKGDACYRLAAAGDPAKYDCALRHLALGIDMTRGVQTAMGPIQPHYENLLEALRQRRDLARSRDEAGAFTQQLESRAEAFRSAFPSAPAGYYYMASARLGRALDAAASAPETACRTLGEAQGALAGAPADRGRYEANFRRVEADIRGAKSTLQGCA